LFFIQLYRWFPSALKAITIVRPETLVRWHRAGFRRYCVGNPAPLEVGRKSTGTCARSSDG
jgi:hypothetical protein